MSRRSSLTLAQRFIIKGAMPLGYSIQDDRRANRRAGKPKRKLHGAWGWLVEDNAGKRRLFLMFKTLGAVAQERGLR